MFHKSIEFKEKKDEELFFYLSPIVILIAADMANYCKKNNMPFVITDTISTLQEDLKIERVSSSHRTRRAIDISVRNWSERELFDFMQTFEEKYKDHAAVSAKTLKEQLLVYHDHNSGWHIHLQVHSRYGIN